MSSKLAFQLFHGQGNVRYGPSGVDLSEFIMTTKGIDRPGERSLASIKGWLMRGFRIDPQTSDITIYVVVSRAVEDYYWELMPVECTQTWKWYVENALQREWSLAMLAYVHPKDPSVQVTLDEGPSGTVNEATTDGVNTGEEEPRIAAIGVEPAGVADEGEIIPAIVDEMAREDTDNERAEDDDPSDDEDNTVNPAEWASKDYSGLVISEEDNVRWEYKENEVIQGERYANREDMKEAVKHFAVSLKKRVLGCKIKSVTV